MTRDRSTEAARIVQAAARARPVEYDTPYDALMEPPEREKPPPRLVDRRITSAFTCKVVGLTFANPAYPANIQTLERSMFHLATDADGYAIEPLTALLVRDPENPHDANAIRCEVPALGDESMIGHIPAAVSYRLAPQLDAGEVWQAGVVSVLTDPDWPDRPGVSVKIWPVAGCEAIVIDLAASS